MVEARSFAFGLLLAVSAGCRAVSGEQAPDSGTSATTTDGGGDSGAGPTEPPVVHEASVPGTMVTTLAGSDVPGGQDGTGAAARFDNPTGLFLEPSGTLLVAEYDGGRIRRLTASGQTTLVSAAFFEVQPFGVIATSEAIYVQTDRNPQKEKGNNTGTFWRLPPNGPPELIATGLGRPRGLLLLPNGKILMADIFHHTLQLFNPADTSFTFLAGCGIPARIDGVGANACFNGPYGASLLPDGSVVLAEQSNNVIRRVTLAGEVTTFAGDGVLGMRDDDDKTKARFSGPVGVAADAFGNVYVSDGGNHRIRCITVFGAVETVAGNGTRGFADGDVHAAEFYGQEAITVTPDGKNLYISDGDSGLGEPFHRVRRIAFP